MSDRGQRWAVGGCLCWVCDVRGSVPVWGCDVDEKVSVWWL